LGEDLPMGEGEADPCDKVILRQHDPFKIIIRSRQGGQGGEGKFPKRSSFLGSVSGKLFCLGYEYYPLTGRAGGERGKRKGSELRNAGGGSEEVA